MLLEQLILKHKAHEKALSIKENPEGVDFNFSSRSHATQLSDFIHVYLVFNHLACNSL
jgi:nonsense-mediated mRNA decay protein 3